MKVLVITNLYPNANDPERGVFIKHQVNSLAKMCTVKVIAPLPFYQHALSRTGHSGRQGALKSEIIDGIEVFHPKYYYTPKVARSLYGLNYFLSIYFLCREMERSLKPDIYLNYWLYPDGFASVLAASLFKKRVIVSARGCDFNLYARQSLLRRQIMWTLEKADLCLAVSDRMRQDIQNMGLSKGNIMVIRNGIDMGRFHPMDRDEARKRLGFHDHRKAIVYVGRFSEEKNVELLIRAFSALERGRYALILVGDGPLRTKLESVAKTVGVSESILFVGACGHEYVPAWMNAGDIVCLPSKREGWPNVLMEALACGKPVIAACVGGVGEIIYGPQFGFTFESENVQDLARKFVEGLERNWSIDDICRNKHLVSWDTVAKEIYGTIQKVVS